MEIVLSPLSAHIFTGTFLIVFMSLTRLGSSWALALLIFSLQNSWHPWHHPELPAPSSHSYKLSFLTWVTAKALCSGRTIFFPTDSSSSPWGWPAPVPVQFSWGMPFLEQRLPGLIYSSGQYSKGVCQPKQVMVGSSADPPPYFSKNQKFYHFVIAVPQITSDHRVTTSPSLSTNITSITKLSLVGSPISSQEIKATSPVVDLYTHDWTVLGWSKRDPTGVLSTENQWRKRKMLCM